MSEESDIRLGERSLLDLVFRFSVVHRLWVGGSLLPAGASSSSTKGRAMFVCLPCGAQPESCTPSRRNSPHWARKWSFRPLPRNTPSLSLENFTEEIAMITKPIGKNHLANCDDLRCFILAISPLWDLSYL